VDEDAPTRGGGRGAGLTLTEEMNSAMATVTLKLNGQTIQAREGCTILEAAKEAGVDIPTLCHHPALAGFGACRMCVVEIANEKKIHPACTYPVSEGMEVQTETPKLVQLRKFVLEMLFSERNHYCMYCEMSGDCELQNLAYRYGMDKWTYPSPNERMPVDGSRQYFIMDHNRCVLCRRCVRACDELVGMRTLGVKGRGSETMIIADLDVPFGDSSCVSCGTCLQVCPTGALIDRKSAYGGRNADVTKTKSICTFCSVGCDTEVVTRAGRVLRVDGVWDGPTNGVLCAKGRFEPLYDTRDRVTSPMVRQDGRLVPVTLDEALDAAAECIASANGGGISALATANAPSECLDSFVALFRNKLNASPAAIEPLLNGLDLPANGALADLDSADCIAIVGADPLEDHPVVGYRIRRARNRGAKVVAVAQNGASPSQLASKGAGAVSVENAVAVCRSSQSPVVVYGPGVCEDQVGQIKELAGAAKFLRLDPAANAAYAARMGLANGSAPTSADVAYVMIGEREQNGEVAQRVANAKRLVVHAAYHGPLTEKADVVLPAPVWCERDGTYVNLEGRTVSARRVLTPDEDVLPETEVLSRLSARL